MFTRRHLLITSSLLCLHLAFAAPSVKAQQAAPAQADVKTETDVVYGTAGDAKLMLDAYYPANGAGKHPAIVLIHGGGWSGGDKKFYAPMGKALAAKGYSAFSINYRLLTAAANKYPAQLDDSQRAVRWIRAHADKYNVDPQRIGGLGDSAGGYLVALLGTRDTRDNSDADLAGYSSRIQCVVDFYGPADFTLSPDQAKNSPLAAAIVANFLGKKPEEAPDLYKSSSPVTYVDGKSSPFLIIHGSADPLVPLDQSERLYNALRAASVSASLFTVYKQGHGFLNPAMPASYGALADEFFARNLKPQTGNVGF